MLNTREVIKHQMYLFLFKKTLTTPWWQQILFKWQLPKNSLKNSIVQHQELCSCTTLIHIALTKKISIWIFYFMLLLCKQQQYKSAYRRIPYVLQWTTQRYFQGALLQDFKETQECQRQKLLTDVNIPVPFSCVVTFFRYHFSILVTILVPRFMTTTLFVAFIVVLLPVPLLWAMPWFSMSVITAPMGLVSVIVIPVRIIVVTMLVWVVLLWLYVSWISAILCFWVKSFLPRKASNTTAMVMVLGWRAMLGFLDGFNPCFLFNLWTAAFRDWMVIPLVSLRSLLSQPPMSSHTWVYILNLSPIPY